MHYQFKPMAVFEPPELQAVADLMGLESMEVQG